MCFGHSKPRVVSNFVRIDLLKGRIAIGPKDEFKWLCVKEVPAENAAAVPIGAEFGNIPALQVYADSDDDADDNADEDAEPRT